MADIDKETIKGENHAQTLHIVRYAEFETLSAAENILYVLGSENWEDDFDALLHLVKEFIVAVWEVQKQKLYSVVYSYGGFCTIGTITCV